MKWIFAKTFYLLRFKYYDLKRNLFRLIKTTGIYKQK
jgi:hypothetical protein